MTVLTQFDKAETPQGTLLTKSQSGFAILHGTFAPEGCVVKLGGFISDVFDGPARVFSNAGDALEAIAKGRIRECDILIIRNDARDADLFATGGIAEVTAALQTSGLERVTVITDGRVGSSATGAVIGNVAPSALAGGPIAYVQDDDIIHIDVAGRRIDIMADIDIRRCGRVQKDGAKMFGAAAERYASMISTGA